MYWVVAAHHGQMEILDYPRRGMAQLALVAQQGRGTAVGFWLDRSPTVREAFAALRGAYPHGSRVDVGEPYLREPLPLGDG